MVKKSTKNQVVSSKLQFVSDTLGDVGAIVRTRLVTITEHTKTFPGWVKSRPATFTKWRKEDKKKKKYRSFRLQKKIKPEPRYIPTSFGLLKDSIKFLYSNKKLFLTILFIHATIYTIFLRGAAPFSISAIQESIRSVGGNTGDLSGTAATIGAVLASSTVQRNPVVTTLSVILMSLVYIWAIRQVHAKKSIKARDAYYQGMTPLIPALLILVVASLQLIPFAAASFVYSVARAGQLFANGFEDLSIFIVALLVTLLSFYWLTSTIIAFYIVTLPGMWPMRALKSAKQTIKFQRFTVFKRILALPIIIGISYLIFLLVIIRVFPSNTYLAIEVLQLLLLPLIHTYLYKLYRSFL